MVSMPCHTSHWCKTLGYSFLTLVCSDTNIIINITITVHYGIFFILYNVLPVLSFGDIYHHVIQHVVVRIFVSCCALICLWTF